MGIDQKKNFLTLNYKLSWFKLTETDLLDLFVKCSNFQTTPYIRWMIWICKINSCVGFSLFAFSFFFPMKMCLHLGVDQQT